MNPNLMQDIAVSVRQIGHMAVQLQVHLQTFETRIVAILNKVAEKAAASGVTPEEVVEAVASTIPKGQPANNG